MFVNVIIDQIVHGVGEEFVETALLTKYFVEHPPIAQQLVLSTGTGVELVVHVLNGTGRNTHVFKIEIRISFATGSHARQLLVKPLDLLRQGFRRHVNDHLLEGLVIVERQNGDLFQRDGVAPQHNKHGIIDHGRIYRDQPPTIAQAAHPKRIHRLCGNQEDTIEVGDGAAMRQLTDHMGVAHRNKTIRSDDFTQYRHFVLKHRRISLRERPQGKGQYCYDE